MVDIYELLRRNQDGTSDYVCDELMKMNIPFNKDSYGNIYNLDNGKVPLLSAHMDTVRGESDFVLSSFLPTSVDDIISCGGILGGDDKCGVYLILKALEAGTKCNFIFSRDEEVGCLGIKALVKDKEIEQKIKDCLYCLVLDRRGNSDIICKFNDYGTKEFDEALEKVASDFGFNYKSARGSVSDANTISEYVSTCNLSVGYHNPHSTKEYISLDDLENAYIYILTIINNLKTHFDPVDISEKYKNYSSYYGGYYGSYGGYGGYYSGYYGYDDYDDDFWSSRNKKDSRKSYYGYDESDVGDFCDFCSVDEKYGETLIDFTLPNGETVKICEYCLKDLEEEIQKAKKKFEELKTKKAEKP